ncbi:isopenicillin N synthase family dioxygenase [Craterilacuibacter sinensis]|uniref:2-oxoglutarate-dependent ethylene/succinate-forming enzyme n=1 Tax=Craterilacuibacter sinensis TaxID=2686017 RepID=A0A845BRE7_9NEIS|nr:2OG-Fe(II) oxygenase family protein [Craterilacuibacter sinensis]MXR37051.1 isopenicillin N synthase family oxygenase [Craterilacuibacter sinensis]
MNDRNHTYTLDELRLESRMGAPGTDAVHREIRRIDLSDFEHRRAEITDQLWRASQEVGFFQLVNHDIELDRVRAAFIDAERFFALPASVKAQYPLHKGQNAGWESLAQVRPSTGTPDQKESYQITLPQMDAQWPSEFELPGFQAAMLDFERQCWKVGMQVLSCFADRLGFERDFFTRAHDPAADDYQSTLRLLHYYAIPAESREQLGLWRAGAHTDFDSLTLLFQRDGQGGLQVCPGKEVEGQAWTSVPPSSQVITCNIGDMLMRWSDDQLPSNFHRVRNPLAHEYQGPRYSIAFFCQANRSAVIQGPAAKYPPITAGDYLQQRIAANFTAN